MATQQEFCANRKCIYHKAGPTADLGVQRVLLQVLHNVDMITSKWVGLYLCERCHEAVVTVRKAEGRL